MTEEKQKKKKPGIIKRIFGWIWLGLLTLLILAALVYDAPWKVLALLLIILAACTALPRPARKWFWLSVAAAVIVLITWVFLPEDNEGWRPYTFEKELAALQAKYAIPDSENAALLYSKLFEGLAIDSNQPKFFAQSSLSSIYDPWLSKDHPETAEWVKGYQKTIDTLMEISRIEKCRFPITANPIMHDFQGHFKIRSCAFLLVSAANNDIAEGRIDAGLEKYLSMIQMAKHLYQQPMMDFLVGFAIENLALTHLNRFTIEGQPTEKQLQLIANSLPDLKNKWSSDFRRQLDYDKLLCKNMFSFLYEINQKDKVRFNRTNPTAVIKAWSGQEVPTPTYPRRKLAKASVIVGWFFIPPTPQKVANIVDATYEKYYATANSNFDWSKKPPEVQPQVKLNFPYMIEFFANMSGGGGTYDRFHELYLKFLAFRRGSRLLVAVKQYQIENGNWPSNLDAIKSLAPAEAFIDPVSGSQFEYERHDSRFSLYGAAGNIWPK
jgi:hypothetical protein